MAIGQILSLVALALELLSAVLLAKDLWNTRRDVQRFRQRSVKKEPTRVPLRKDFRRQFDVGDEPAEMNDRLKLRDERVDRLETRLDEEIDELRTYVKTNVERLMDAEAERRLADDAAASDVIVAITIGGTRLRAISLLLIFVAIVLSTAAQLAT